jgi:putative acetyltransferase
MVTVRQAAGAQDMQTVRELFLEYQAALGVDLCFQGFAEELASLPGKYISLLLALSDGKPLGCVALRPFDDADGEMKRLYVRPAARGRGIGRMLAARVIDEARRAGYRRVVLDTLPSMKEAQALYRSLGFREVAPYYANPIPGTSYLALPLSA